jgi:hypothetical protein
MRKFSQFFRYYAYEKSLSSEILPMKELSQSFRVAFSSNSVLKDWNFVDIVSASIPVLLTLSYMKSEVLRMVNMTSRSRMFRPVALWKFVEVSEVSIIGIW